MNLAGKTAAVTGAVGSIGSAVARTLAAAGAHVVLIDVANGPLESLATAMGTQATPIQLDLSDEDAIALGAADVSNRFGGIDILINNAGISMRALVKDLEVEVIEKVMDINFKGTLYCTKLALDSIIERKGSIVGVSSIAGYRGLPGRSGYSASKFAVTGFLEALRTEMIDNGVNVMWVCPGFTTSNIRHRALNKKGSSQGESPMDEGKMMSSEKCADYILRAIEKRKRTLVLTFKGKQTVFMNRFFPSLTDKLVKKFFFKNRELVH